jgi:hypothetical protein
MRHTRQFLLVLGMLAMVAAHVFADTCNTRERAKSLLAQYAAVTKHQSHCHLPVVFPHEYDYMWVFLYGHGKQRVELTQRSVRLAFV